MATEGEDANEPTQRGRRSSKTITVGPSGAQATTVADDGVEVAPAAPQDGAAAEVDLGRRLQRAFLVAALIGFLTAFLGLIEAISYVGFAGPLLTIVGFYWWGHRKGLDARGDTRQRFADSCYFLGFLLTMCAMLIGFFPAGMLDQALTSQGILRHFSMALGATALGLVFRIVALQGGKSIEEDVSEVEAELRDYARKVTVQARAIGDDLVEMRAQLNAHGASLVEVISEKAPTALEGALQAVRGAALDISRELTAQMNEMRTSAAAIAESLQSRSVELAQTERDAAEAQDRLDRSLSATAEAVSHLSTGLSELHTRLASSVEAATRAIADMANAFEGASRQVPALESGIAALGPRIDAVGSGLVGIESGVAATSQRLAEAENRSVAAAQSLEDSHRTAVAGMENAVNGFADRVAASAEQAINRFQQQMGEGLDERIRQGAAGLEPVRARAEEFERSIATATERFASVVDSFARELAALRREEGAP